MSRNELVVVAHQRYEIPEAAEALRISRSRIYAKIKAGELSVIKDGRRSFISGAEIIRASQPAC